MCESLCLHVLTIFPAEIRVDPPTLGTVDTAFYAFSPLIILLPPRVRSESALSVWVDAVTFVFLPFKARVEFPHYSPLPVMFSLAWRFVSASARSLK